MTIDRYQTCRCGSGKKIKFCCSDLLDELETIDRMMAGDQRLSCLEHIHKTLEKHPNRACLLAAQAEIQSMLQEEDAWLKTIDQFAEHHPENVLMWTERAIYRAMHAEPVAAVDALQHALESVDKEILPRTYQAIGIVAQSLLAEGHLLAAQSHLLFQATIGGAEDTRAMALLAQIVRSGKVPVLLTDEQPLSEAPDEAPWRDEFGKASAAAMNGLWLSAAQQFENLSSRYPESDEILRNLAILHGCTARPKEAVAAWRSYAALDSVAMEDAVEALAVAHLIDGDHEENRIDIVSTQIAVRDIDLLLAALAADPCAFEIASNPATFGDEGEPPPRGVYFLLDRAMPETGVDIAREAIPTSLGQCLVYGRETDRDARLQFIAVRDNSMETSIKALKKLGGDALGEVVNEETVSTMSRVQEAVSVKWQLPTDTPPEHHMRLLVEQYQSAMLNIWPTLPIPELLGRTLEEASQDAEQRTAALAVILVAETAGGTYASKFDFNQLRSKLGLPELTAIDPTTVDVRGQPLVRLARLEAASLSDDDLIYVYRRATVMAVRQAIGQFSKEVVQRPSLDDQVDKAEAYGHLAEQAGQSDEALEFLSKAKAACVAGGGSPAMWMLGELECRIVRRELEEADAILSRLRARHIEEKGVSEALYEMLSRFGIIGQDGRPVGEPPMANEPVGVGAAAAQEMPAGKEGVWTPESDAPQGGKKSAIWTPDS